MRYKYFQEKKMKKKKKHTKYDTKYTKAFVWFCDAKVPPNVCFSFIFETSYYPERRHGTILARQVSSDEHDTPEITTFSSDTFLLIELYVVQVFLTESVRAIALDNTDYGVHMMAHSSTFMRQ